MLEHPRVRHLPTKGKKLVDFLGMILAVEIAIALAFGFVFPFVMQAFWIPSKSMVPTLHVGDRVFVNKFIYRFHQPERHDIVVFKSDEGSTEGGQQDLIKRVVGMPGDEISIQDGGLFVNGERQEEPYLNHRSQDTSSFAPAKVPEDKVFVMGDNRADSLDSRYIGPVSLENIEGEAFIIFWPLWHIRVI